MRIGFLFNHDATHQVPHTIPIAGALAARGVSVEILCSTAQQRAVAEALLPDAALVRIVDLSVGPLARLADAVLRHVAPYRRLAILRENLARFAALDALVVPEITSTRLRTKYGMHRPRLIYVPHGAGDGAAGFLPATRHFDLVLLSGEKIRNRMLALGLVSERNAVIVGYPKFDLADTGKQPRLFADDKPVVLYNPHFNPLLSSWYRFGPALLRWFASQSRFNLVFAPHVMLHRRTVHTSLIHRRIAVRPPIPREAIRHPGILIDTGSRRSIDMSYVRAADIYLGDVSSQIYEWIQRPRPAIFLDTHKPGRDRAPDYAHWSLGEVLDDPAGVPDALERAVRDPGRFAAQQKQAASATFSITDRPAGERAADAILSFLEQVK